MAKSKQEEEKTTLEYGVILEIDPNEKQKNQFRKTFGCSRWVYNYFLSIRRDTYKYLKESISYNLASSILTDVKKEYPFLKEVDKFALQNVLKHLDFAFERFFKRVKEKKKPYGYPRFKSKSIQRKAIKRILQIIILNMRLKKIVSNCQSRLGECFKRWQRVESAYSRSHTICNCNRTPKWYIHS